MRRWNPLWLVAHFLPTFRIDADWTPAEPGTYALTVGGKTSWFYNRKIIVR
jgi:hypothetical protein